MIPPLFITPKTLFCPTMAIYKWHTALLLLTTISSYCAAQTFSVSSGNITKSDRMERYTRSISKTPDGYHIIYKINSFQLLKDGSNTYPAIKGFYNSDTPGKPDLPQLTEILPIPKGYTGVFKPVTYSYEDLNTEICGALTPDYTNGSTKDRLPIEPYTGFNISTPCNSIKAVPYRDIELETIQISPLAYDYENKVLRIYYDIEFEINFVEKNQLLSCTENNIGNHQSFESLFTEKQTEDDETNSLDANASYLIITTPNCKDGLNEFIKWKRMLGYNVILESRNNWTPNLIKTTIKNHYTSNPSLTYLLLVGNNSDVPGVYVTRDDPEHSHYSDYPYGCVISSLFPELYRGRWDVDNWSETEIISEKIISYERDVLMDSRFFDNAFHAASFEHSSPDTENMRCTQSSEEIKEYLSKYHDKYINRFYWDARPEISKRPYYWEQMQYGISSFIKMPDDVMDEIDCDNTFEEMNANLNEGVFYVLYRGHGGVSKFGSGTERPHYNISDLTGANNIGNLPVFFNICCHTGDFSKDCLASAMLKKPNGGASAVFASSTVCETGYIDALLSGMFHAVWPDPGFESIDYLPTFNTSEKPSYHLGQILDKGLLAVKHYEGFHSANRYPNHTASVFHCFGDPSMVFRTTEPEYFSDINISRGLRSVSVSGLAEKAYISFYNILTDEVARFYGVNAEYHTVNPDAVTVTVFDANHLPYIDYAMDSDSVIDYNRNQLISVSNSSSGVITVNYNINSISGGRIVAVNMYNNNIAGSVKVEQGTGAIGIHITQPGIYAVSLSIGNDSPCDTKKIIVSKF